MFVFFCIFLYCRMYKLNLCTNKGKNMTKITIRLINPILQIDILRPAILTNFTQSWRKHCNSTNSFIFFHKAVFFSVFK